MNWWTRTTIGQRTTNPAHKTVEVKWAAGKSRFVVDTSKTRRMSNREMEKDEGTEAGIPTIGNWLKATYAGIDLPDKNINTTLIAIVENLG